MRTILLLFAAIFMTAGTAALAETPKHVAAYQQYNAALDSGDVAGAIAYAEEAWRAGEDELGDSQTTAVLAYNYANLIYYRTPEKAIEPLQRVIALTGERSELFGPEPPILMLRLAEAYLDPDNRRKNKALVDELEMTDTEGSEPTPLNAFSWQRVGMYQLSSEDFNKAKEALDRSVFLFRNFRNISPRNFINALIAAGVSRVAGTKRSNDDIIEAYQLFTEAIDLFPLQESIETFDEGLATAMAWRTATRAAAETDNPGRPRLGSRISRNPPEFEEDEAHIFAGRKKECRLNWEKWNPPEFPQRDLLRGYIGGVLVGYHTDGLNVVGARVLAEAPQASEFGENALEVTNSWRLAEPAPPECSRNLLAEFQFIISD